VHSHIAELVPFSNTTVQFGRGHGSTHRQRANHVAGLPVSRVANDFKPAPSLSIALKPRSQTQISPLDDNQQLLCVIKLYFDALINDRIQRNDQVDLNDRLAFFIPLIIIYWTHRHPREPLPYTEIDSLLEEVGEEAEFHRRVMADVMKTADRQCARNASTRPDRSRDHRRAIEALRILREWLDDSQKFESGESPGISSRQSGAREIRHWFESLINLNKKAATSSMDRSRGPTSRVELGTTTSQSRPTLAPPASLRSQQFREQTSAPVDSTAASNEAATVSMPALSSGEPFGWPHYTVNHTTTTESFNRANLGTTASPEISASRTMGGGGSFNVSLVNQLRELGATISNHDREPAADETKLGQYREFFDMVSSIIDEINSIHSASGNVTSES